jgi:hypothetical protein
MSLGIHGRTFPEGNSPQSALSAFPAAASLNDDLLIRKAIANTIRHCTQSREQIADAMSLLLGQRVTEKMLNSYSSQSMQANRFPAAWQRAFCKATGSDALLRCCAELAGFQLLTVEEAELLELGREYLRQKRAAEKLASIERRLAGVEL